MADDSLSLFPGGTSGDERPPQAADPQIDDHRDVPLAERMRPRSLDEIVGQETLVGSEGLVRRLQGAGQIPSLILHGPPGTGKTTLGRLLARAVGAAFVPFSAVSEGVPRLREIMKAAEERRRARRRTLLFIDEIHRLNKGQQDFLLPFVESGLITLVGATTEHPAFEVNTALLSRTRVLVLEPLGEEDLRLLLRRSLEDAERGLGELKLDVTPEAEREIVVKAAGDARQALTALEVAAKLVGPGGVVDVEIVREALQQRLSRYDTTTAFQLLSAFHKSLRSSQGDAALYWAMRMIRGGEDPLVLLRRIVAAAYEDVGLADPQAGIVAVQAMQAFERLGAPEGYLPLANAILYVASAPKSNRAYLGMAAAREAAERFPDAPVPLHLRNASTSLMRDWGFGQGYRYAHDFEDAYVDLQCLPDEVAGERFYDPSDRGFEATVSKLMRERGQLE
ncbi:MAG: AAA family ATPase [Gemmatimonas sp.]|nr:AAA family ATPase [Gemmatimonas sp.]